MKLAADMGHHSGRATPSLHDAPYRQFNQTTGRQSTYPLPIPVQTNRATSLIARMIAVEPPAEAFAQNFQLPLTLATKPRLDAWRQQQQHHLHPASFSLNAGAEGQIELCWLGTVGALQFYITHEAGESEFMLLEGYTFEIEISGEANPVRCRVRLFVTNDETGAWDCELLGA